MTSSPVRVRIAPSPTGYLHVGTARTALFNYLFAKHHAKDQDARFVLRIEDTDRERSQDIYTQNIYDSLKALGLVWDEGPDIGGDYGPYAQSERLDLYQAWAKKLEDAGHAYRCYHTAEELEAERAQAQEAGTLTTWQDSCRDKAKREALAATPSSNGTPRASSLRFCIPEGRGAISFQDAVRGEVSFDAALLSDFVILKSDGMPTYNFAVVVDDHLMQISHVIRGEDHISNTPRQLLIYEALGVKAPQFAHVGMILAPDRSKLSKRHGAVAVSDYIQQGYLPEAFCNFIALLGWSPPDGEELGDLAHFAQQFSLERITHSSAIFEKEKLNHLNGKWIRRLELADLLQRSRPYLSQFDLGLLSEAQQLAMLDAVREKITLLAELPEHVSYFFGQSVILDAQVVGEALSSEEAGIVLQRFQQEFLPKADFTSLEALSASIKAFSEALKPIKTKIVMWALRAAITGRTQGADLAKVLQILGKEVVTHRTETAITLSGK